MILGTTAPKTMAIAPQDVLDAYIKLFQLAQRNNQTVGEKNDYYVTILQLETVLMRLTKP